MDYTALSSRDIAVALQQIAHSTTSHHARLIALFQLLLPAAPTHLPLIYHTPRRQAPINRLVLSVTAKSGIYSLLTPQTAVFLHRPWDLDRRRLTPSTLVLTSHQRLDELLTTGHNTPLLHRLGCADPMVPITGYKNDPERKMGLVARLPSSHQPLAHWIQRITSEFQGLESTAVQDPSVVPRFLACMNAFEPTLIDQSIAAAQSISSEPVSPAQLVYLTGQSRPLGATYAERLGMPVLCTGHRRAEVWAVNWLAQIAREVLGWEVLVVDEEREEEEMQKRKREERESLRKAMSYVLYVLPFEAYRNVVLSRID
ncbi:hypothetical protein QFC20_004537 [Naganishia adeliensis]|uniref:Uncharacterized protein n=1 Tax=Naganishia adeliensis TaxID=92952 RepID=A0ACC2W040_9TREE|nr:hypothetical protein QFC20_004537 [Naganishia adeliensis]